MTAHDPADVPILAPGRLAHVFVEAADSLVADFDVVAFLHTVASRAAEISGSAEAGLVLADAGGRLHHIGSSDERARLLELVQVQDEQGPCRDCYVGGVVVVDTDLATATGRWPLFAPRAVAGGFGSVHTFPMRLRDRVIGALDVFGQRPGALGIEVVGVLQALADIATIALLQEQAISRADLLNQQLRTALESRIALEQAKGAVAASLGVDVGEAFERMRRHARATRMPLTTYAHELLRHPSRIHELRSET
jgi:GAF domain-containing protein